MPSDPGLASNIRNPAALDLFGRLAAGRRDVLAARSQIGHGRGWLEKEVVAAASQRAADSTFCSGFCF